MIHIFGGGTLTHVRSHFALCAPAYGSTAKALAAYLQDRQVPVELHLTRMAGGAALESNTDVERCLAEVLAHPATRAIVFNVALCDFDGEVDQVPSGRYAARLQSRNGEQIMRLLPAKKLLGMVKAQRPDVCLVGFKTTADATVDVQLQAAHRQRWETGADFVFANDVVTRQNLLLTPAGNAVLGTRLALLCQLAEMLEQQGARDG